MLKLLKKSPLAPKKFPNLPKISGIKLFSIHSGIRKNNKSDAILILMPGGANVACVLTKSNTPSAPVIWCKKIKNYGKAKALVVNSGNANAHTGMHGLQTVRDTVDTIVNKISCNRKEVYVCSTGIIGEKLDSKILIRAIPKLLQKQESSWDAIAESICTTDTFSKGAKSYFNFNGKRYKVVGIAKGSGMIFPNMGTMLGFIFTDFPLNSKLLNIMLKNSVENSFNSITVDGDTSTSDTCILFSVSKNKFAKPILNITDSRLFKLRKALDNVLKDLAKQIVCDGEGAKKLITVNVNSAKSYKSAKTIAFSIANSSLVKTAIAGEDPNWGRIVMAVGKSNIYIKQNSLSIFICGKQITKKGCIIKNYDEKFVAKEMKKQNITLDINLGLGKSKATVWTCDLTHDYIKINADYRS